MTRRGALASVSQRLSFYGLAFLCAFLAFYNSLASIGIGLAGLGVLTALLSRQRREFLRPHLRPAYFFFGACILATLANPQTLSLGLVGLRKALLYLFCVLAAVCGLNGTSRMRRLLALILACAFIASLDGYYQLAAGRDFFSLRPLMTYPQVMTYPQGMVVRVTGPFHQAATLAIYLECVLAGLMIRLIAKSKRPRLKETIAAAALLGAIILTFTPASPVVLGAVFFIAALRVRRPRLLGLLLAMPLVFVLIPTEVRAHLLRLLSENLVSRARMLEIGLQIFRERPFLGHGLNTFSQNYVAHALPGDPFYGLGAPYAHNMYVQLACETGLGGLAAFFGLVTVLLRRLLRPEGGGPAGDLRTGLAFALIAFLLHGLFESSLQTSHGALIFWVLTGLCLATFGFTRRENLV